MTGDISTSAMTRLVVNTDNVVKLPSPVKSPLSIDVILLLDRYLRMTSELSTIIQASITMPDSVVTLPSPVKSPLSIDVILLRSRRL